MRKNDDMEKLLVLFSGILLGSSLVMFLLMSVLNRGNLFTPIAFLLIGVIMLFFGFFK